MKKSSLILLLVPFLLAGCGSGETTDGNEENQQSQQSGGGETAELYSIKVTTNPTKTTYVVGESFDPAGMVVIAKYKGKDQEKITDYTYSTEPFTKAETVKFEISYGGKTTTVTLYVKEAREDLEQEYTQTILTSGPSFAGSFNAGYHFDTADHKLELANYFYDQVDYENLITNVETDNLHAQKFNTVTYLQFGSGSGAGSFVWHSIEKIYKVEINVLCYAKEDTYHGITNIDSWSHIAIDDTDFDMTYDGKTNPQVQKYSVNYPNGVTSFKIESSMGRVYMQDMTITWRG